MCFEEYDQTIVVTFYMFVKDYDYTMYCSVSYLSPKSEVTGRSRRTIVHKQSLIMMNSHQFYLIGG